MFDLVDRHPTSSISYLYPKTSLDGSFMHFVFSLVMSFPSSMGKRSKCYCSIQHQQQQQQAYRRLTETHSAFLPQSSGHGKDALQPLGHFLSSKETAQWKDWGVVFGWTWNNGMWALWRGMCFLSTSSYHIMYWNLPPPTSSGKILYTCSVF